MANLPIPFIHSLYRGSFTCKLFFYNSFRAEEYSTLYRGLHYKEVGEITRTGPRPMASRPRPLLLCDDVWGPGTKFVTISIILKAKGEPENFGSRIRENNLYPSRSQIQVKKYNVPSGRRHIFIYVCSRFFFQISVGEIHNFQLVVSSAMAATKTEAVPSALRNAGK